MTEATEWLDVEEAARYLAFHPNTVYHMIREGKLPALRFPVRIRRRIRHRYRALPHQAGRTGPPEPVRQSGTPPGALSAGRVRRLYFREDPISLK